MPRIYTPTCKQCFSLVTACNCPKPKREDYDRIVQGVVEQVNDDAKHNRLRPVEELLEDMPEDVTLH